MVGEKVHFTDVNSDFGSRGRVGIIKDKVNIPIISGPGYCPMDNYVIEEINEHDKERNGKLYIVNPINIIKKTSNV